VVGLVSPGTAEDAGVRRVSRSRDALTVAGRLT
jgi:hypothetical protein